MALALTEHRDVSRALLATASRDEVDLLGSLQQVRELAAASGSSYAGSVLPELAWKLFEAGQALLVDVRTPEELSYVGRVPGATHLAWATGTAQVRNPRFLRELESKLPKDAVVMFLCRSGKRSAAAAEAATKAGYRNAFNVLEGFEGEIDDRKHRGGLGGWRHRDLPWVQD